MNELLALHEIRNILGCGSGPMSMELPEMVAKIKRERDQLLAPLSPPAEGVEGCPFCGAPAEKFDGDYMVIHKDDCWLRELCGDTSWICSERTKKLWNTRQKG